MSSLCQAHIFLGVPLRETITAASSNKTDQKDEKEDGCHLQRPLFLSLVFDGGKDKSCDICFSFLFETKVETDRLCFVRRQSFYLFFFFFFLRLRLDLPNYLKMSSLQVKKKKKHYQSPSDFEKLVLKMSDVWSEFTAVQFLG